MDNGWAKINLQKLLADFVQIFLPKSVECNKSLALLPKLYEAWPLEQYCLERVQTVAAPQSTGGSVK